MGKKMGINEKAAEARAKKNDAKASAASKKEKAAEDEYWNALQTPKGKKDAKREDGEKRRLEAAAKKAELKKLAAEEEAELAKLSAKKKPPKKVTQHVLKLQSEEELKKQAELAKQRSGELRREVSEDQYAQQVEVENMNREDVAVDARSLDAALAQMTVGGKGTPEDRHPEKRAKAAWEDYYARELVIMKEEKPGLKMMQYKNRIFEKWQRSPENPRNQVPKE